MNDLQETNDKTEKLVTENSSRIDEVEDFVQIETAEFFKKKKREKADSSC